MKDIFQFHNAEHSPEVKSPKIVRNQQLVDKIVIVTGQPGCGKSMFSAIVASLDRVEKLTLAYEIENVCALRYLQRMDDDVAISLIRLFTDLRIYNLMMSRETNFRPTDVSSIFRDTRPLRYLRRLLQKGDEAIPERIIHERPILHLTTCDLLSRSEPVFAALGKKLIFIKIVRHPLYMLKQEALNMQRLLSNARHFQIYFSYKDKELPYFAYGWEDLFLRSNNVEKAIYLIENMTKRTENFKKNLLEKKISSEQIITIPFESFVIHPWSYLEQIEHALETKRISATYKTLKRQNIPRKMYADGLGLKIYKRCGWEPSKPDSDENKEFALRRTFAKERASSEAMRVLDQLCAEYEDKYLGGKKDY